MPLVKFAIKNTMKMPAGEYSVDEDTMLCVPKKTDPSEKKRAGDLVQGDYFCHGRSTMFIIDSIL